MQNDIIDTFTCQRLNRCRELEIIQVTDDRHIRVRVEVENLLQEIMLNLGLHDTLYGCRFNRRLVRSHERVITTFRLEMVGNHKDMMSIEHEFANDGLTTRAPSRRIARDNTTRAIRTQGGRG